MEMIGKLRQRYEQYLADVAQVYAKAGPTDGLFGWGDDPKKDPCHMGFYEDLERWTKEFRASSPSQEAVMEAVRYILETPDAHRGQASFWFMFAAQGLTRELIPMLRPDQCAQLRELYDGLFPRRDRMPVQKEVYKLLKKHAGRGWGGSR